MEIKKEGIPFTDIDRRKVEELLKRPYFSEVDTQEAGETALFCSLTEGLQISQRNRIKTWKNALLNMNNLALKFEIDALSNSNRDSICHLVYDHICTLKYL